MNGAVLLHASRFDFYLALSFRSQYNIAHTLTDYEKRGDGLLKKQNRQL